MIAYATTGATGEASEGRREALCACTQEALKDVVRENWAPIFRFTSFSLGDIYRSSVFEEWYRPDREESPVGLFEGKMLCPAWIGVEVLLRVFKNVCIFIDTLLWIKWYRSLSGLSVVRFKNAGFGDFNSGRVAKLTDNFAFVSVQFDRASVVALLI